MERAAKCIEMACHISTLSKESEVCDVRDYRIGGGGWGWGWSSLCSRIRKVRKRSPRFHDVVSSSFHLVVVNVFNCLLGGMFLSQVL
jgi:hypothetical protein